MFSIQIRVDEGKKKELLKALNGLRQNIDFEFQAADEQHKQSVTDPGTDESGKASKPEKRVESTGRTHNSNATTSSVVVESSDSEDGGEDRKEKEPTPNEIATKLNRWLDRKGIARVEFAKHINRSKSTFADMLNHPPGSLPRGFAKEAWLKMYNFLQDENAQKEFLDKAGNKKGKKRSASANAEELEPPKKRQTRATFEKWQTVMLDGIFVNCGGRPEKSTIKRICPTVKLEQRQVNISF